VRKHAIESHIISLSTAFEAELANFTPKDGTNLLHREDTEKRFTSTLQSFFNKYDKNGNGVIDPHELRFLLKDVGETMSEEKFNVLLKEIDEDGSGAVSFPEFTVAMKRFMQRKNEHGELPEPITIAGDGAGEGNKEEEDEEEEHEEVPEDLATLPPKQQKLRILLRSGWMMGLGTVVVLIFSDPMVDVLNTLGERFSINAFYVAFVLAPIASNASELIASIAYATKKTKKTITISLAALEGAACMNNTFCLGIFLCLIFFKGLTWQFSAETIAIILVELALFLFALKKTHRIFEGIIILSLYPLSILVVWFLENVAKLN